MAATINNNQEYHRTGSVSWQNDSMFGETDSRNRNTATIKTSSAGRTNINKLLMGILLLVVTFVGCYACAEHIRLQAATNLNVVLQSNQQTLLKLATDNAKPAITTPTLPGSNQQLSSYGPSGQANEFASYKDLIAWLKKDDTHEQLYSSSFECVDFAMMMSEHAIKDGYWIFPAVDLANGHMQCIAPIGNNLYAIEPQTNVVSLWAMKDDN